MKRIVILLGVVVIGFATWVFVLRRENARLRATLLGPDERTALRNQLWDGQQMIRTLERNASRAKRAEDENGIATENLAAATGDAPDPTGGSRMLSALFAQRNDPRVRDLLAVISASQVGLRYTSLFRQLALPPESAARLKKLLADKWTVPTDVIAAASENGVTDPALFYKLVAQSNAEIDQQIHALLGDESFGKYRDYQQLEPQRAVVQQLQTAMSGSTDPLSPAQADSLVAILARQSTEPNSKRLVINDSAVADASRVLSSPQLTTFRDVIALNNTRAQLHAALAGSGGH